MHRLIAVLLSDGYVNPRRYTISFTENKELVMRLIDDFQELGGISLKWKVDKHHKSLRARTYSKALIEELYKICNSFRKRPCSQNPACKDQQTCQICEQTENYPKINLSNQLLATNEQKRQFLRYYASCDGGVSITVYRRKDRGLLQLTTEVKFGSTNPYLKSLIKSLLNDLGFKKIGVRRSGISLKNFYDFDKFQREISFLEEAKVKRGKFRSFMKNELLDIAIKCKKLSNNGYWINKLKTKEKVLEKILSLRE